MKHLRSFENFDRSEKVIAPSNKSFGFVFFVFFLILTFFSWKKSSDLLVLWGSLAGVTIVMTLLAPQLLKPFNVVWNKFGLLLHSVMTPILMGLMFYLVFFPLGIFLKLFKKLNLKKGFDSDLKTYWITRPPVSPSPESMKNSF